MYNHVERPRHGSKDSGLRVLARRADTEVVLALYLERASTSSSAVRGMYAIAILDFRGGLEGAPPKLVLARDPLGIKPLYVSAPDGPRPVASPPSCGPGPRRSCVEPGVDREALTDFLSFGFVLQPRTMLRGRLDARARHRSWCDDRAPDRASTLLADSPRHRTRTMTFHARRAKLRAVSKRACACTRSPTPPVGAFFSGGTDSSAVVGLMAQHTKRAQARSR